MNWYKKIKFSQKTYNPDDTEPLDLQEDIDYSDDYHVEPKIPDDQFVNKEPELKTLTPEDFIEKDIETTKEEISEKEPLKPQEKVYPTFTTVFQALRWAKYNHETIRINYTTLKNISLVRDIEPVGDFIPKSTKRRNVACFDATVNDIRSFIINRISGYQFTGKKFTPKFNFSQKRKNYMRRLNRRRKKEGL